MHLETRYATNVKYQKLYLLRNVDFRESCAARYAHYAIIIDTLILNERVFSMRIALYSIFLLPRMRNFAVALRARDGMLIY